MWYAKQRSDIWYVSFTCVCGGGGFFVVVVVLHDEASRTVLNASESMDRESMLADQNRRG